MITKIKKNVGLVLCLLCIFPIFTGCDSSSSSSLQTQLTIDSIKDSPGNELKVVSAKLENSMINGCNYFYFAYEIKSNQIIFDRINLYDKYDALNLPYTVEFYIGDKNTVAVVKEDLSKPKYIFTFTEEMYGSIME